VADSLPSGAVVRFLQPELKGARPSKLLGKGILFVEESSLVFAGKKTLPFWVQLLVVVAAAVASVALLGVVAWPIAAAILIFGRVRHRESWPAASIQSVKYESGRHRFLVTANVGAGARCAAWQTLGDSEPLAEALRRQFPSAFRDEAVRGWRTY
jgi:hypothetical protein